MASTEDQDLDAALLGTVAPARTEAEVDEALLKLAPAQAAPAEAPVAIVPRDRGQDLTMGLLRGMADVGYSALDLVDYPAQGLENLFGPITPPEWLQRASDEYLGQRIAGTVAESRAARERGIEDYQAEYGDSGAALTGRIGGNLLLTLPAMQAAAAKFAQIPGVSRLSAWLNSTRGGRVAADVGGGALQGGEAALMTSGGYNTPVEDQVGLGMVLGGVAQPLVRPVLAGGQAVLNRLFGVGETAAETIAAPAAAPSAERLAGGAAAQAADDPLVAAAAPVETGNAATRQATLEKLGMKPTRSIISRDPLEWATERELAKSPQGAPLLQTYTSNNEILRGHIAQLEKDAAGKVHTRYDAGKSVIEAVDDKWDDLGREVSKLYGMVREAKGAEFGAKPTRLLEKIDEIADASEGLPMADAIKRRLTRYGVLGEGATRPGLTVNQAEELRKFIAAEGAGSATRKTFGRQLVEALDDDVLETTGDDAFKAARAAFKAKVEEFGIGRKGRGGSQILKDIVEGRAQPDSLLDRYVTGASATAEDLASLQKSLMFGTPEQIKRGTQAFNDLRAQTARWILEKATNGNVDEGLVSYPGLRKAIEQIGPQKLRTIFGEEGATRYADLLRAARDSSVAPGHAPVNWPNTSNALLRGLEAVGHIPGMPGTHEAGLAARVMREVTRGRAEREAIENALMMRAPAALELAPRAPVEPWLQSIPPALLNAPAQSTQIPNRLTE